MSTIELRFGDQWFVNNFDADHIFWSTFNPWQVETCDDGNAALEKISGEDDYDLLLVDYDLPGANGLEIVNRARELDHRCAMPMVVLAASPVEAAARDAGADVFLHKPQGISSLVETISHLLHERELSGVEWQR